LLFWLLARAASEFVKIFTIFKEQKAAVGV